MKSVIIFFLSLCFLLLTGQSSLYSSSLQNKIDYSSLKSLQLKKHVEPVSITKSEFIRNNVPADSEPDAVSADETEDEDELIAPRKYVEITNYLITFFHSQATPYSSSYVLNRLPFCTHFSYTSSDIYIVQRVIKV